MEASRIEETELSKELCERLLTHFREQVGKVFKIGIIRPVPSKLEGNYLCHPEGVSLTMVIFFSSKIESDQKNHFFASKFQIFYADRIIF